MIHQKLQVIILCSFLCLILRYNFFLNVILKQSLKKSINYINDSTHHYKTIADICTGSGCIALGLKSIFSESNVTGLDISTDALSLAKENSKLTNLDIEFNHEDVLNINGDLLVKKWDCIISNPPYIPSNERESIAENVLNFEPEISLFVENDNPIIFYEAIVKYAKSNLSENGFLFFEIHPEFSAEISDLLKLKGFINIELRKDLQGKNRMIKAQNA